MTHDPNPRRWYAKVLIQAYKATGKWTELAELAERELKTNPNSKPWYEVLWEAYTWTGETEKAAEAERMVHNIPDPPED
jgi:ABC-type cobalt transport system substrate-binding protein